MSVEVEEPFLDNVLAMPICRMDEARQKTIARWLFAVAIAVECLIFARTCFWSDAEIKRLIWAGDTGDYVVLAESLWEHGVVPPESTRVLGYPLFLCTCIAVGGSWWLRLVLAGQLAMNAVFTWVAWRFSEFFARRSRFGVRIILTSVVFVSGLVWALTLMSDMQAAMFFALFLYGLFFMRTKTWVTLAGCSAFMTTLTRPNFSLFFLLLPILGWLIGKFSTKVPKTHLCIYAACILAAGMISWRQNQISRKVVGGESLLQFNLRRVDFQDICNHKEREPNAVERHQAAYEAKLAAMVGEPPEKLTRGEKDDAALQLFKSYVLAHPFHATSFTIRKIMQFALAPVEGWTGFSSVIIGPETQRLSISRYWLFGICLPLWFFSYCPPLRLEKSQWAYYIAVMLIVGYVLAVSGVFAPSGAGERYRVSLLPLMFSWAVASFAGFCNIAKAMRLKVLGKQ